MMKYLLMLIMAMPLASCGSNSFGSEGIEQINRSAIYDPPTITLLKNKEYQFAEGVLVGDGQKFHSHYSYLRAVITGEK